MLAQSPGCDPYDPDVPRPQGRAAPTEGRRGKDTFVPRAGNFKAVSLLIDCLFVQAMLHDQGEKHLVNARGLPVLETISVY